MARQIVVEILGKDDKFKKTMDSAAGNASGFGSKFKSTMTAVAKGTAIAGAAVVALSTVFFDHGKDLEALRRKAEIVFGDQIGTIDDWAEANAHAMGLTKSEAVGAAAAMGDLLIPMGFARDEAAAMSQDVVGLAGALSEWSGGQYDAAEVSNILTKAMLGEREQLKSLGISITAAEVQQRLLQKGQEGLTGAALQQAQALATQELIMEKSVDAQNAFAEGQGTGARAAAEWGARIREGFDTVTQAVYPATTALGPFLMGLGSLTQVMGPVKTAMLAGAGALGSLKIGTIAASIAQKAAAITSYALGAAIRFMSGPIGWIITAVGLLAGAWATNFGGIQEKTAAVVNFVKGAIGGVVDFFRRLPGRIADIARRLWDSIPRAFKGAINMLIGLWNRLGFTMPVIDIPVIGKFGGFRIGVPQIPYMHAGGIVPGPAGADVPAILQAGERVIPRSQAGTGSGITINVHGSVFGDLDQFADYLAMRLRLQGT